MTAMTTPRTRRRGARSLLFAGCLALAACLGTATLVGEVAAVPATSGEARTAASAAAPATDGRILYINGDTDHRLETMNPDGTGIVALTGVEGFVLHPVWMPDASGIVFATDAGGPFQLAFIEPDGTGQRTILEDQPDFQAFTPAVTPNGRRIVFSRCPPDGSCALFSVRLDGSGLTRLTAPGDGDGDFWPDVSPGGKRVAFSRFGAEGISVQTWVMRIGGGSHPITKPALEAARPRWLPTGRRMLLVDRWVHFGTDVLSIRADGTHLKRLTSASWPHSASLPSPSPSGRRILYVDDTAYADLIGFDQFLMNADGSGKQLLRSGRFFDSDWGTAPLLPASSGKTGLGASGSGTRPVLPAELAPWASALQPGHGSPFAR